MTTTSHPHLPVQETSTPTDAVATPVPSAVSVSLGTGAAALLPPQHPANATADNAVARWSLRLVHARPVDESA